MPRKPETFEDLLSEKPLVPLTQAERVLRKFGGPSRLSTILNQIGYPIHRTTIYRWTYPKGKRPDYTGGIIPQKNWPALILAAQADGIILTSEDLDPRRLVPKQ